MTGQDPTAARNAYLAQVLANPPAHRQPCAADCGQPLTSWHTDAEDRRWHPDCLPDGTTMTPEVVTITKADLAQLLAVATLYIDSFAPDERLSLGGLTAVQGIEEIVESHGRRY